MTMSRNRSKQVAGILPRKLQLPCKMGVVENRDLLAPLGTCGMDGTHGDGSLV